MKDRDVVVFGQWGGRDKRSKMRSIWRCMSEGTKGKDGLTRVRTPFPLIPAFTEPASTSIHLLTKVGEGGWGPSWHCAQNRKCGFWQPYQRPQLWSSRNLYTSDYQITELKGPTKARGNFGTIPVPVPVPPPHVTYVCVSFFSLKMGSGCSFNVWQFKS